MATTEKVIYKKPENYNKSFTKAVRELARKRKSFTTDDVVARVGLPPQSTRAIGALMAHAVSELDLVPVGEVTSTRSPRRHALITVWSKKGK